MKRCIWCKQNNGDSAVEHIIPDALGCPENFTLSGGLVCRHCNNSLADLDQAVIGDFDISLFMANIPRKKGRSPSIRTRGNLVGTRYATGPMISINMGRLPAPAHDGTKLGSFGKSRRNINATFTHSKGNAEVNVTTAIGQNPKFVRGIYKIGFSSLVFFLGDEIGQSPIFDPIREFVRNGIGRRYALMLSSEDSAFQNRADPPYRSPTGHYGSTFRLAMMEFCVDLSPDHSLFPVLKNRAAQELGTTGWTWLPLDEAPEPATSLDT